MKKLKKIIAFLLAAILCVSVTGCTIGQDDTTTEQAFTPSLDIEQTVTLNIIGSMQNFEALEAVIADFKTYYPNCTVTYSSLDKYSGEFLEARLRSDNTVDIFMSNSGLYSNEYIAQSCADLNSFGIDFSAISDDIISSSQVDGKMYNIPLMRVSEGLIINETLLEKEGVAVPTNYSEFLSACQTLKDKGYTPIQGYSYNFLTNLIRSACYVAIEQREDKEQIIASMSAGEDSSVEIMRSCYTIAHELVEKGYISPEVNDTYEDNYNDSILRFFEGDVPFLAASTECFSGMKKRETKSEAFTNSPFTYRFICTPFGEDDGYSYVENWTGFSINENGTQKEWAAEFLNFLLTEDEINELAYVKGMPSIAKNNTDERFAGLYPSKDENFQTNTIFVPITVQQAMNAGADALIDSSVTVDDALNIMLTELKQIDSTEQSEQ